MGGTEAQDTDQEEIKLQLERTKSLLTRPLRLTGVYCVSSAEPTHGLDTLMSHIIDTANNTELFPSLRRTLPRTWVDFELHLRDMRGKGTEEYQSVESTSHVLVLGVLGPVLGVESKKSKWLTREEYLHEGQLAGLTADRLEPVLSYLQQVGTILRYTDIPELKDLVFHDPSGLIDVMKELFHHDLNNVFSNKNPRLNGLGFSNTQLKKIRKNLSSRGFLPRDVVIALLGPHATPVGNVDVITKLIEHFGLCYTDRFDEQDGETSTPAGYYIPWYIQEERPKSVRRGVRKPQKKGFTVTCEMAAFCPRGLFERLSVVVNKLITSRQDWKDVIVAVTENLPVVVYRETKDDQVNIIVKLTVPAQAVQGTQQLIWDNVISPLKDKLSTLLKEWPGLLYRLAYSTFTQPAKQKGDSQTLSVASIIPTFEVVPRGCIVQHGGVTLEFPEGCVRNTRFISVEVEAVPVTEDVRTNLTAMSAVLTVVVEQDFPQRFLRPVTVRLPWVWTQSGQKKEDTAETVVLHYSTREDGWTVFPSDVQEGPETVVFQTDRFQSYVVTKVKDVCIELVQLWGYIWNGYCEDKVYLIVMPNKVFLPDRFVNLLCVHKTDDVSDFFTDRNRYSVAVEKKEGVPEKDIYEGRISFERLNFTGNVRDVAAGQIANLPVELCRESQRERPGNVPDDVLSQHPDTDLRQRSPSQQEDQAWPDQRSQQRTRPEPTAPSLPRQQRYNLPVTAAILIVAVSMIVWLFHSADYINNLFTLQGGGDDGPTKVPIILLLNDEYGTSKGGLSTINCQVGQMLIDANAVVYCTALRVPERDREAADREGVQLIQPDRLGQQTDPTLDWLTYYHSAHFPNLPQDVTCIIGHADITDTAAKNIKDQRYPEADLVMFTHVLPEDTDYYKGGRKAMKAWQREKDMLDKVDNAKAAFSVGRRIFDHFDNMYRGDKKPQSHHIFLPKPSKLFFNTDVRPGGEQKVVLSIGRVRKVEKLKGHDLAGSALRDVVKKVANVRWCVRGISEDDHETSKKILEDNLNSPDLIPTLRSYGTQADIRDDMMTAHLVLMPSRSEPFGLVGLEAIATGIPVLISDKTGLAEMINDLIKQKKLSAEHRHVIVETSVGDSDPVGDAKRWADKIVDILEHSDSEFEKAARFKQELVESKYWEDSHRTFLRACGIPAGADQ
ncbi:hypothetical protein Bbelb_219610 [Branchiostoma belcheri]|nr:hypothetical protein Bbelb_219610 [Branchiostoma belcheri]